MCLETVIHMYRGYSGTNELRLMTFLWGNGTFPATLLTNEKSPELENHNQNTECLTSAWPISVQPRIHPLHLLAMSRLVSRCSKLQSPHIQIKHCTLEDPTHLQERVYL